MLPAWHPRTPDPPPPPPTPTRDPATTTGDNPGRIDFQGSTSRGVLGPSGFNVADARCWRSADAAGSGQRRSCDGGRLVFGDRHGLYRRESGGKGFECHKVLLAEGIWAARVDARPRYAKQGLPLQNGESRECGFSTCHRASDKRLVFECPHARQWPALARNWPSGSPDR